ncbi:prepilin-type N-terminal cleavage/methylation domain-containing protein [Dyella solisilvae]|uniref:Prepilin-type N-terminal cleavage/methylation domain-containing protein n=1 Tax=Dyella solisilvae TaxID=1920168 RepID=A0A370KAS1_9GAMM|nr:type IV pilin protein [Dyella solisilvae]RDI99754.1 prepilin-type N-terminal cleavage/methylation domain-containing protein [Dyella solisilvae]
MSRTRGFTLVELMVVVAIIAILAAIAIPSYSRYAYRARRADGQQLLLHIANAEERYYATYNKYAGLAAIGYASADSATSEHQYYQASVDVADGAQSYTATATRQGAQQADVCGNLAITSAGVKTPQTSDAAANSNGHCW